MIMIILFTGQMKSFFYDLKIHIHYNIFFLNSGTYRELKFIVSL